MRTQNINVAPYLDKLEYRRLEREEVTALFVKIRCAEKVARLSDQELAGLAKALRRKAKRPSPAEEELRVQLKQGRKAFRANVQREGRLARDMIVRAHLALVPYLISGWTKKSRDPEALVQEGNLGLLRAIAKFDPGHGVLFSTYASFWIRAYVQRRWHDGESVVHSPLRHDGHVNPTPSDASLDAPLSTDEGRSQSHLDLVADESEDQEQRLGRAMRDAEIRSAVATMAGRLKPIGRDIVWNRLATDSADTLDAVARRHSLSRERIRQIELSTKLSLRRNLAHFARDEDECLAPAKTGS